MSATYNLLSQSLDGSVAVSVNLPSGSFSFNGVVRFTKDLEVSAHFLNKSAELYDEVTNGARRFARSKR